MPGNQYTRNGNWVKSFKSLDYCLPSIQLIILINLFFCQKSRKRNIPVKRIGVSCAEAGNLFARLGKDPWQEAGRLAQMPKSGAIEGLARMIATFLKEEFSRNPFTRLTSLFALPVLNAFKKRVDPGRYNGASLLGLRGIVVKSHGSADDFAFGKALERAADEARYGLVERISERMAQREPQLAS